MKTRNLKIGLTSLFFCFVLLSGAVAADQLHMKNGDIISGTVSSISDNQVFIKPSYAEEFAVDLAEVESIEAEKTFEVALTDGRTIEGEFAGASEGEQKFMVGDSPMTFEVAELTSATDPYVVVEVDPWEGTGEFGLVSTSGNTETFALNMRLNFIRTSEKWVHRFTGTALNTSEDGIQDNERYTVEVQSNRKLSDIDWLFGAFRWDSDKFGSYDPSLSFSAGYGRLLMQSDKHEMRGEAGLGYRKMTETVSGFSETELIGRFLLDDWWQIWPSTRWTNRLLIETGSSNTFTQFNTGLALTMTERFGLKLGFEIRNNSKIPPGDSEHTDTITSANLVYNF
jgi:putative salt-induced outer membrane protein